MFECVSHHYLDGYATPNGVVVAQIDSVHTRRPVMVDPIANGADIEIPVLIVGAGLVRLSSGGGTGLGLPSW
jgi:hypothetical protein